MKFENAYDTVKSDEMFNGDSAPAASEINTIAAAEVFEAGEKPDVPVESQFAASVDSYEDKFEEIEQQMDAIYGDTTTEMDMQESYDPGLIVEGPSVEIKPVADPHAGLPDVELVVPEGGAANAPYEVVLEKPDGGTPDADDAPYEFVLEEPEADPVEHVEANIELVVPDADPVEHVKADIQLVIEEPAF